MSRLSTTDYKNQAKRLRADLAGAGIAIGHGKALEMVAHQHGFRDWNTLAAQAEGANRPEPLSIGQRVTGIYLRQPFTGRIVALEETQAGLFRTTVLFDEPVDVVRFKSFSNWRSRVTAVLDEYGLSHNDSGQPNAIMQLERA